MSARVVAASSLYTDTVSELTYGELQRRLATLPTCCAGSASSRRTRRHDHARHGRFPVVSSARIRAGIVPVPLNTL